MVGCMALYPVIMAGGSGTRFWPLSRQARPKQFLPLASKSPLITDTAARLKGLASMKNTFIVCGPLHARNAAKLVKGLPKQIAFVGSEVGHERKLYGRGDCKNASGPLTRCSGYSNTAGLPISSPDR